MGWAPEWTDVAWKRLQNWKLSDQTIVTSAVKRFADDGTGCEVFEAEAPNQRVLKIGRFEVLVLFTKGDTTPDADGDAYPRDVLYVLGVSAPAPLRAV